MSLPPSIAPSPVSLGTALRYWFQLGLISFGGPAGQIALMHAQLVEQRRWISERRFLHALNYCMLLPGPEATQLAVYIGWLMHGARGGIIAGVLFVLPSLLVLIALSWLYLVFSTLPVVAAIMAGIKPAIVALVLAAAWRIGRRTLHSASLVAIALAAFVAIAVLALPFPLVVLGAAASGAVLGRWWPAQVRAGGSHAQSQQTYGAALIDDATAAPLHAAFSWWRLLRTILTGCLLAGGGWLLLAALLGPDHPLVQMAGFFTKAALLTFGGAYAVLPYVYQGGVDTYHWLSAAQMMDGLALGESTPGPLIMIVAFIGFIGNTVGNANGAGGLLLAGSLGAVVATVFTFLPSFVFILAGAPLIEASRDDLRMTAPLTAISAAVVGVIASLALFFGRQVFWNGAAQSHWNLPALAIGAAAALALLRFGQGSIRVLLACAGAGLVLSYLYG